MDDPLPGNDRITVRDVARRAGVSRTTVHRVLHENGYASDGARRRVLEAVAALQYRPNAIAQSLRRQRSGMIGHVVHTIYPNPFFACVAAGVEQRALACGLATLTCNTHGSVAAEGDYVELLLRHRVEGIIFTTPLSEENVRRAHESGTPVCVVERPKQLTEVGVVLGDNYGGARAATDHLLDLGHRAIGFVGAVPEDAADADRYQGYVDALADRGVPPVAERVSFGGLDYEHGRGATRALLDLPGRPTAIVFAGDLPAVGALQTIWERQLRVPEDLSVVSIGDSLAATASPPLTAVAIPMWEMGAAAVDMIMRASEAGRKPPPERLVLPMRLVVRASCSPVQTADAPEPATGTSSGKL